MLELPATVGFRGIEQLTLSSHKRAIKVKVTPVLGKINEYRSLRPHCNAQAFKTAQGLSKHQGSPIRANDQTLNRAPRPKPFGAQGAHDAWVLTSRALTFTNQKISSRGHTRVPWLDM